ncbi:MAG: hypothetical protein SVK08_04125 [Halobacteriota archaeon]|nr:hypothetical protein [Halobacteriota archaeon]
MKLENWSVVSNATPYTAPEAIVPSLQGYVYNHPKHEDGKHVITSHIVAVYGRKVQTWSGSIYELGKVDPKYQEAYPDRDLEGPNPITMKEVHS